MKLRLLAPVVVTLATALITGCGPGMTPRARTAQAPTDVFQAVDAELANAIPGTATLTSATLPAMPLPESRMPVSQPSAAGNANGNANANANDDAPPPVQTWGAPAQPVDPELAEYGF